MARVRTRNRQSGFSLVELMATVFIAGVAFAGIVPLFTQVSSASSAERSRTVARNIAQQRVETIRLLDYSSIDEALLNDGGALAGRFGNSAQVNVEGGTKVYTVTYDVAEKSVDGRESYKEVSVTVTWDPPPSPVKPVTMITNIYKQWDGPDITNLAVEPVYTPLVSDFPSSDYYEKHKLEQWLKLGATPTTPVAVKATIDTLDAVNSMTSPTDSSIRGYVRFSITPKAGATLKFPDVKQPVGVNSAVYTLAWDWDGLPEGQYTITAVAFSFDFRQGEPYEIPIVIEKGDPPSAVGLTGLVGNAQIALDWAPTTAGDFEHYELTRTNEATGEQVVIAGPGSEPLLTTEGYLDVGLTNDVTYTYSLVVVDNNGHPSPAVTWSGTPTESTAVVPSAPYDLRARTEQDQAILEWLPPTATPVEIVGYQVFRDGDATPIWSGTATSFADTIGYNGDHHYQVRALSLSGGASDFAALFTGQASVDVGGVAWARAQTGAIPTYTIHVVNLATKKVTATVYYSADNGASWSALSPSKEIQAGLSADWTGQPPGLYQASYAPNKKSTVVAASGPSGTPITLELPK